MSDEDTQAIMAFVSANGDRLGQSVFKREFELTRRCALVLDASDIQRISTRVIEGHEPIDLDKEFPEDANRFVAVMPILENAQAGRPPAHGPARIPIIVVVNGLIENHMTLDVGMPT